MSQPPQANDHTDVDPHVERKYEIVKLLGKGAYGVVWRAIDRKSRQVVALKKVFDAFTNATDAQRTYREVMFLQRVHHETVIRLLNVLKAENRVDLYLVFEYMETDLFATIRTNVLQDIHKRFVTYQLLRCVRYLHRRELLHRDLKPANILLNSDCHIKLADFGLARSMAFAPGNGADGGSSRVGAGGTAASKMRPVLTDYIATRWYRPPEIVSGSVYYSRAVDMWAVGCIIGEMLLGKPIFPGTSTLNQLERIIAAVGVPTAEDVESLRSQFIGKLLSTLPSELQPKPLHHVFAALDKQAADLMCRLLVFNPHRRLSAAAAMAHPYVSRFCTPEDLIPDENLPPIEPIILPLPDEQRLTVDVYRDALYNDILQHKREARRQKMRRRASASATGGDTPLDDTMDSSRLESSRCPSAKAPSSAKQQLHGSGGSNGYAQPPPHHTAGGARSGTPTNTGPQSALRPPGSASGASRGSGVVPPSHHHSSSSGGGVSASPAPASSSSILPQVRGAVPSSSSGLHGAAASGPGAGSVPGAGSSSSAGGVMTSSQLMGTSGIGSSGPGAGSSHKATPHGGSLPPAVSGGAKA